MKCGTFINSKKYKIVFITKEMSYFAPHIINLPIFVLAISKEPLQTFNLTYSTLKIILEKYTRYNKIIFLKFMVLNILFIFENFFAKSSLHIL